MVEERLNKLWTPSCETEQPSIPKIVELTLCLLYTDRLNGNGSPLFSLKSATFYRMDLNFHGLNFTECRFSKKRAMETIQIRKAPHTHINLDTLLITSYYWSHTVMVCCSLVSLKIKGTYKLIYPIL